MDIIGMIILAGAAAFAAGYNIAGDTYIVRKPYDFEIDEISEKARNLIKRKDVEWTDKYGHWTWRFKGEKIWRMGVDGIVIPASEKEIKTLNKKS